MKPTKLLALSILVVIGSFALWSNQQPDKVSAQTTQTLYIKHQQNLPWGKVTSSPAGVECGAGASQCDAEFEAGAKVTLTGFTTNSDISFMWGQVGATLQEYALPCERESGHLLYVSATCTVTIPSDKTITLFVGTYYNNAKLTVVKKGTGSGTVTSDPTGINCGKICSASFPVGLGGPNNHESPVGLNAKPDPGSVFVGWDKGTDPKPAICYGFFDAAVTASPGCFTWIRGDQPSVAIAIFNKTGGSAPTQQDSTPDTSVVEEKKGKATLASTNSSKSLPLIIAGLLALVGAAYGFIFRFRRRLLPRFLGGKKFPNVAKKLRSSPAKTRNF